VKTVGGVIGSEKVLGNFRQRLAKKKKKMARGLVLIRERQALGRGGVN